MSWRPWRRLVPSRAGLWVVQAGGARLHPWRALLPFLLLPLLFLGGVTLAVNRQSWALALLLDQPGNPAARGEAEQVWWELNRAALLNLLALEPVRERAQVPTVTLEVSRRALDLMQESIHRGDPALGHEPGGDKPYVHGAIRDERGRRAECKVAYRGLTPPHHWAVKPSLRVRVKTSDVYSGQRYFELERPEDVLGVINWLPEQLGHEQGLLSSCSDHVRLFVNRRFLGVYVRHYRPGEPLALAQERLPGAFFKGDAFDPTRGVSGNLFAGEGWQVVPADLQPGREALEAVLDLLGRGQPPQVDAALLARLEPRLDLQAWARWAALMTLVASVHSDAVHNQVWFWNTERGRIEPLVWDANGYEQRPDLPVDVLRFPLLEVLACDPAWVHQRNQALAALLDGPGAAEAQIARVDALLERLGPDLRADPNLGELTPSLTGFSRLQAWPVTRIAARVTRLRGWLRARESFLRDYLGLARAHLAPHPQRPGWTRLQVAGTVAVRVEVPGQPPRTCYPGLSRRLFATGPRAPTFALPVPRSYDIPAPPDALTLRNAITGGAVELLEAPAAERPSRSLDPPPAPSAETRTLGPGPVLLSEDLHLAPGQTLRVLPGTELRLQPGVGIYARGQVLMEGTAEAPIALVPAGDEPWACLGLRGPGTAGTRLRHVTVRGGSVGAEDGAHFLGMLSIYHCPDLELSDCVFAANRVGDDATNLACSQLRIRGCRWEDARSDGLDLDSCQGVIEDCAFLRCGNDGLDLSTSRIRLTGSRAEDCGDKGISAGEGTRLLATRFQALRCRIGVEAKDASAVALVDSELRGCGLGLHAYQKKWAWDLGGAALLVRTRIEESRIRGLSLEKRCACVRVGGALDSQGWGAERVLVQERVPAPWETLLRELGAL